MGGVSLFFSLLSMLPQFSTLSILYDFKTHPYMFEKTKRKPEVDAVEKQGF